jgi:hypothetical protein
LATFNHPGFSGPPHVDVISPVFLVIGAALTFGGLAVLVICGFAATGSARNRAIFGD